MSDRRFVQAPKIVTVSFGVEPAFNAIETLEAIAITDKMSGMGQWAEQTARELPPDVLHDHLLVFRGLHEVFSHVVEPENWPSFLAFLDTLETVEPVVMRDKMLDTIRWGPYDWCDLDTMPPEPPPTDVLLNNVQGYLDWLSSVWPEHSVKFDTQLHSEAHALLQDPAHLKRFLIDHLRKMWHEVIAPEWERNLPMIQESVAAFQQLDYSGLTVYEAIRAVTSRDLRQIWPRPLERVDHVIFVPAAHSGPYVSKFVNGDTLRLIFQARLPKGATSTSSALSRSELLVRLNALADDTRLRILELLSQEGELCAQDIITLLDLSQSSVSRHLSQLSASGYITERRRDVAKCYSLNSERIEETYQAMWSFLKRKQPAMK